MNSPESSLSPLAASWNASRLGIAQVELLVTVVVIRRIIDEMNGKEENKTTAGCIGWTFVSAFLLLVYESLAVAAIIGSSVPLGALLFTSWLMDMILLLLLTALWIVWYVEHLQTESVLLSDSTVNAIRLLSVIRCMGLFGSFVCMWMIR